MKSIVAFEEAEYKKLMETLGLEGTNKENDEDKSEYFNAWNFGHAENDYEFVTSSSLNDH